MDLTFKSKKLLFNWGKEVKAEHAALARPYGKSRVLSPIAAAGGLHSITIESETIRRESGKFFPASRPQDGLIP